MFKHNEKSVFNIVSHLSYYKPDKAIEKLTGSTKDSLNYVQRLGLLYKLRVHDGCVNSVIWNDTGEYLLSGSDDQFLVISDPYKQQVKLKYKTLHSANIFSARFLPQTNNEGILSCSGDGIVLLTELLSPTIKLAGSSTTNTAVYEDINDINSCSFTCHKGGTAYDVLPIRTDPRCFFSCGEDGTVRMFDLRLISRCHKSSCKENIFVFNQTAVNSIDLSPISENYLAVGSSDGVVRLYDRRFLSIIDFKENTPITSDYHTRFVKAYPIPFKTTRQFRITSVKFSQDESELLASYSSEYLYLFDLKNSGGNIHEIYTKGQKNFDEPQSKNSQHVQRRLRLRGDWSDTGPRSAPENENTARIEYGQSRPLVQGSIMTRMTEVISRLMNDRLR
ncbi:DDB1- and CUL4-associated factor 6-like, partial [Teleopsis dalmanni]